jgi:integrase
VPTLGTMKLLGVRPNHPQALYAAKLTADLAPRTVLIIHRLLHRAFKDAVRWGLVCRNVTEAVIAPKVRRKEMMVWSSDQALAFLKGTAEDRLAPAPTLMLYCGLRAGELAGLRWEDIDLAEGRLQIQRTVQRVRGVKGLAVGDPKSASSRRQIVLPAPGLAGLVRWRTRQRDERAFAGERRRESGHVFTSRIGTVLEPRIFHRSFDDAVTRLGLPSIRVHDLRHTCATLLLSRGVRPKIVQELLGHNQISLTLDTSSHVLPSMQEEAARTMEAILGAAV